MMSIIALMLITTSLALSNASVPADMHHIHVTTIENAKVLYHAYMASFKEQSDSAQTATVSGDSEIVENTCEASDSEQSDSEVVENTCEASDSAQTATVSSYSAQTATVSSYSGVVENTCEASYSFMKTVDDNFNLLPEKMRNRLINNGWQFKVVSHSKLKEVSEVDRSILGFTEPKDKTVYIDNREAASETILHEAYHALDVSLGYMSKSNEFKAIYKEELQAFRGIHSTSDYNVNTSTEYYAEAGQVYILNPEKLKKACPKTYDWLEMNINGTFCF